MVLQVVCEMLLLVETGQKAFKNNVFKFIWWVGVCHVENVEVRGQLQRCFFPTP